MSSKWEHKVPDLYSQIWNCFTLEWKEERPFSLGFSTGLTSLFLKSVGASWSALRISRTPQEDIQGIVEQSRYKLTLPRYKLTLGQNNSVQSQCVQTLRRLSSVSETWWGDLQGFHFANSTVRASLHLSGNTTETAPREDAVTPENLCSCTCKPVKLYSFSPKHIYSGRNII